MIVNGCQQLLTRKYLFYKNMYFIDFCFIINIYFVNAKNKIPAKFQIAIMEKRPRELIFL